MYLRVVELDVGEVGEETLHHLSEKLAALQGIQEVSFSHVGLEERGDESSLWLVLGFATSRDRDSYVSDELHASVGALVESLAIGRVVHDLTPP